MSYHSEVPVHHMLRNTSDWKGIYKTKEEAEQNVLPTRTNIPDYHKYTYKFELDRYNNHGSYAWFEIIDLTKWYK